MVSERSRPLSRDEESELLRSNKKVKDSHHSEDAGPDRVRTDANPPKSSFRDKLVGEIPGAFSQAFDFSDYMDAESDSDGEVEELTEGLVSVSLSKETKQRIRAPWSKALIVKVFGRTVGFNFLHSRLMTLWKPSGRVDMVDLGRDFFLLRFSVQEDLEVVLRKGLWFVGEHFLSIRKWEANFKPSEAQVTSVAVWVRLNELPIEYYDTIVLRQIGQALGKVLRIDTHTASEARGRYARICVQVDITKPLITTVRVGKRNHLVAYEGVSKLCFSCGRLGHQRDLCQYTVRPPSPPPKDPSMQNDKDVAVHQPTFPAHSEERGEADIESTEASFGPWMVVTRKRKDGRESKKSGLNPFSGLMQESLVSDKAFKPTNGPQADPSNEGKRKAQSDLVTNVSSQPKHAENSPKFSNCQDKSPSTDSKQAKGNVHNGQTKVRPLTNSVKGKKEYARSRATPHSPCVAAATPSLDWSANITKLYSVPNGDFTFSSPASKEVGRKSQGVNSGDTKGDCLGDKSPTNSIHGLVQVQAMQGMENGVPIDPGECNSGDLASDSAGRGKDKQVTVEDSLGVNGSVGTVCVDGSISRPDDGVEVDDRMDSDGGSDGSSSGC